MDNDLKFILVDDDDLTNLIHDMTLKDALGEKVLVETFEKPEEALEFIQNTYAEDSDPTILFLDINMPGINGWEFLKRYEKFSAAVKSRINIYILSSSVDPRDVRQAEENKNVLGFLSKPLSAENIISITAKGLI